MYVCMYVCVTHCSQLSSGGHWHRLHCMPMSVCVGDWGLVEKRREGKGEGGQFFWCLTAIHTETEHMQVQSITRHTIKDPMLRSLTLTMSSAPPSLPSYAYSRVTFIHAYRERSRSPSHINQSHSPPLITHCMPSHTLVHAHKDRCLCDTVKVRYMERN